LILITTCYQDCKIPADLTEGKFRRPGSTPWSLDELAQPESRRTSRKPATVQLVRLVDTKEAGDPVRDRRLCLLTLTLKVRRSEQT
jgi:hypothetical protein